MFFVICGEGMYNKGEERIDKGESNASFLSLCVNPDGVGESESAMCL